MPSTDTIHRYLISSQKHSFSTVANLSPATTPKQQKVIRLKQAISMEKIEKASKIANLLSKIPTIKLICATGSIAINNADQDADLDLFIVTSKDTLWLTRPLVFFILKALRLRRSAKLPEHNSKRVKDKVCDNLWLDESALKILESKRNLYTAHEVLQAKPLFDRGGLYQQFIHQNSWTKTYLANAYAAVSRQRSAVRSMNAESRMLKALNFIFYKIQYLYMKKKITNETITLHSAFFHPNLPHSASKTTL
jgi:predicted nucleotidyltransferase